jgi:predicted AAA+ superfamily ATPase
MIVDRHLGRVAFDSEWGRQMRFIAGPRQAGKTTLARRQLESAHCEALYYLWDDRAVRLRARSDARFFLADVPPGRRPVWICLDEIHKFPGWKNTLKAAFDGVGDDFRFIVTGSAKLDWMRRAGDSLAGRYFTFHLMPLFLSELAGHPSDPGSPSGDAEAWLQDHASGVPANGELSGLLQFGGFPEPCLRQSARFLRRWRAEYADSVIREDLASLTRVTDRERVRELYDLLPGMVGSPISESSMGAHIQVSPPTAKSHLQRLGDFYLAFPLRPWSRNIKRSLLKAAKYYLYDWTAVEQEGARFENWVACELRGRALLWSDQTGEEFSLHYVRNKQKQETDFLVVRNRRPWMLVEAKVSDGPPDGHHEATRLALGGIPFCQVCRQPDVSVKVRPGIWRVSADRLFSGW